MSLNSLLGKTKGFPQNSNHCHRVEISHPFENALNYSSWVGKPAHKTKVTGILAATQNCLQNETEVDIGRTGKHAHLEAAAQWFSAPMVRASRSARVRARLLSTTSSCSPRSGTPGQRSCDTAATRGQRNVASIKAALKRQESCSRTRFWTGFKEAHSE